MIKLRTFAFVALVAAFSLAAGHYGDRIVSQAEAIAPDGGPPTVQIEATSDAPAQPARFWAASTREPLVVDLHQWSADEKGFNGNDQRFDQAVHNLGWNFIRPGLGGPNTNPKACCSRTVMAGIESAIDYAKLHGDVDPSAIYVVGVSGGAYTALCAYMSGAIHAKLFVAWAPITDLALWHAEHPDDKYGRDVVDCTGSHAGSIDGAACARRSPMSMGQGQVGVPVYLFAGIHDGFTGSVPITHSVRLFNRLADLYGAPDQKVSNEALIDMVDRRTGPDTARGDRIGGRLVHLARTAGSAHLTVFEGGHEMLTRETLVILERDYQSVQIARQTAGAPFSVHRQG